MSAGGVERIQRETTVRAAEERGAGHPESMEEVSADERERGRPHTDHLEDVQTETEIPAPAQGGRNAPGGLQGASGSTEVTDRSDDEINPQFSVFTVCQQS